MKLFFRYLKGHKRILLIFAIFCMVFVGSFLLYHLPLGAVLYPTILCGGIGFLGCVIHFNQVKQEHESLQRVQTFTDTMTDTMTKNFPIAQTIQDDDYQKIIQQLSAEHHSYCQESNRKYTDMMEYYTVWAHQIKTPIASMRLHLQNEDSSLSRTLSSDLFRIEQYVDMVLTFLRLDSESTDYVFQEYHLDKIVKSAVKKFSSEFISRKLSLVYEPLNTTVVTDEKWLSFVIEQVLSNALKYTPSGCITISLVEDKTLRIEDTGIGIAPEDLPRIFENGYTGYNGRTNRKSSGIGLYLCKRICKNLGHPITVSSTIDVGTAINIDLSQQKNRKE